MHYLTTQEIELFDSHPFIRSLAKEQKWTVSSDQKRPLNFAKYLTTSTFDYFSQKRDENGDVIQSDVSALVTLPEIERTWGFIMTNRAYRMSAAQNNVLVLDIEPEASQEIRQWAMSVPHEYAEHSTNGGLHVFIRIPNEAVTPETSYLLNETVIKSEDGAWEMIGNRHFVTFTRRIVPEKPLEIGYLEKIAKLRQFLEAMVMLDEKNQEYRQNKTTSIDFQMDESRAREISRKYPEILTDQMLRFAKNVDPDDYKKKNGEVDLSRYEWKVMWEIGRVVVSLKNGTNWHLDKNPFQSKQINPIEDFNESDMAQLIYELSTELLEPRSKHTEKRDGLPFLQRNAVKIIGARYEKETT
jgi:hypothetical protein